MERLSDDPEFKAAMRAMLNGELFQPDLFRFRMGPVIVVGWKWGMWFRVFGYGLHLKDSKYHFKHFAERSGHMKAYYFGRLRVMFLTRKGLP